MKARGALIILLLAVLFAASGYRLTDINKSRVYTAASLMNSRTIEAGTVRGGIFDKNGKPLVNSEERFLAAVIPSPESKAVLKDCLGDCPSVLNKTEPFITEINREIPDSNSVALIRIPKRYSASPTAAHIIGYIDAEGKGRSGIEKAFDSFLTENSTTVSARFGCDAAGNLLLGHGIEISGNNLSREEGVYLTIDRDIQKAVESNMVKYQIDKGAVVVIDVKTGGIAAIASAPAFSQTVPSDSLGNPDSPFVNRALSAFSVGSVFKPAVAAAALENGFKPETKFTCEGEIKIGNTVFHCHDRNGHGSIDLSTAIEKSCNIYFIKLANEIGKGAVIKTARKLCIGKKLNLAPGITGSGNLPDELETDSPAALANLSFGQGELTASPLRIAAMYACIAGGGIYRQPFLITGTKDISGAYSPYAFSEPYRAISEESAALLRKYLEKVVSSGTGKRAKSEKFKVAGKTATAQTGRKNELGEEICNSWFAGYFPADNPEYAMVVFKEDGGEGALSCAPAFKTIAEEII